MSTRDLERRLTKLERDLHLVETPFQFVILEDGDKDPEPITGWQFILDTRSYTGCGRPA